MIDLNTLSPDEPMTKQDLLNIVANGDEVFLSNCDLTLPQDYLNNLATATGHFSKYYDVLRIGMVWHCGRWAPVFLTTQAKEAYDLAIANREAQKREA